MTQIMLPLRISHLYNTVHLLDSTTSLDQREREGKDHVTELRESPQYKSLATGCLGNAGVSQ